MLSNLQQQGRRYVNIAGLLYLLIAIIGGFSIGYVPALMVSEGNASLTYTNLLDNMSLFKIGVAGDVVVLALETVLTVMLFQLFRRYSKTGMLIATYSRLAMAIIMAVNLLNYMAPLIMLQSPSFLQSFSSQELEALVLFFLQLHKYGELSWQLFFAIHLFTLGYVLNRSSVTARVMGVLMTTGGIGYAGDSLRQFLMIDAAPIAWLFNVLLLVAVIAELWFAFWLLFQKKGISVKDI